MDLQSIDHVISALDTIVQRSYDTRSRLGYFAALYRRVTCAVRDGIWAGSFNDNALMERLDVVFALRYLDALQSFQAGGTAARSWMVAFHACENADFLILQQLLCGMNAHINFDLSIAAAQVSPGSQLPQLKVDFDEINGVLASMIAIVAAEIAAVSPLIGDLENIGLRTATSVINFDIVAVRAAAWLTAERLVLEPPILHDTTIAGLDLAVSLAGRAILYPAVGAAGLRLIQEAECKDVRVVIEKLSEGYSADPAKAAGAS